MCVCVCVCIFTCWVLLKSWDITGPTHRQPELRFTGMCDDLLCNAKRAINLSSSSINLFPLEMYFTFANTNKNAEVRVQERSTDSSISESH